MPNKKEENATKTNRLMEELMEEFMGTNRKPSFQSLTRSLHKATNNSSTHSLSGILSQGCEAIKFFSP